MGWVQPPCCVKGFLPIGNHFTGCCAAALSLCWSKRCTADARLASVAANPAWPWPQPWPIQLLSQEIKDQELGPHTEHVIRNHGVIKTINLNFWLLRPWFGDPVGPAVGLMGYKCQDKVMQCAVLTMLVHIYSWSVDGDFFTRRLPVRQAPLVLTRQALCRSGIAAFPLASTKLI